VTHEESVARHARRIIRLHDGLIESDGPASDGSERAMGPSLYEFTESIRIAMAQIRANKMRSALTALGVVIGIVAVTLMGTAIRGIDIGFNKQPGHAGRRRALREKWPWTNGARTGGITSTGPAHARGRGRAEPHHRRHAEFALEVAVFVAAGEASVKAGAWHQRGLHFGTTADYGRILTADFRRAACSTRPRRRRPPGVRPGLDVARRCSPGAPRSGDRDRPGPAVPGHRRARPQGSFLGLFSFDNQMRHAARRLPEVLRGPRRQPEIQVKVKDKTRLDEARRS
jgi:putative ABC transport system permease protein